MTAEADKPTVPPDAPAEQEPPPKRPLGEAVKAIEARQKAQTQELVDALRKTTEAEP